MRSKKYLYIISLFFLLPSFLFSSEELSTSNFTQPTTRPHGAFAFPPNIIENYLPTKENNAPPSTSVTIATSALENNWQIIPDGQADLDTLKSETSHSQDAENTLSPPTPFATKVIKIYIGEIKGTDLQTWLQMTTAIVLKKDHLLPAILPLSAEGWRAMQFSSEQALENPIKP